MACYFKNFILVNPAAPIEEQVKYQHHLIVDDKYIRYIGDDLEQANSLWSTIKAKAAQKGSANLLSEYDGQGYKVLMPTFANCHSHLAMCLMRNFADDENLEDWLYKTIFPLEKRLRPNDIKVGTELACLELIAGGVGLTCDMYFEIDKSIETVMAAGLRYLPSLDDKVADAKGVYHIDHNYIDRMLKLAKQYDSDQLKIGYMVHSIYSSTPELYEEVGAYLKDHPELTVQVHVSETQVERDNCLKKFGKSPVKQLAEFGILRPHAIAAHCVYLDDEDRAILAAQQVTAVNNPISNMKLGSGFADVKAMLDANINVALGTDGAASNNSLDMFAEVKTAALVQHGIHRQANVLSCAEMLKIATYNGYVATGMAGGQLKVGEIADLQVIDLQQPNTVPKSDPLATLLYSTNRSQVESMMVLGKFIYRNYEYLTLDRERILYEVEASARYIRKND